MPAEGGILHPHIQPWHIDPRDVTRAWKLHQRACLFTQVVQVPRMLQVLIGASIKDSLALTTKPRTINSHWQISSIFYSDIFTLLIFHMIPIVFFHFPKFFSCTLISFKFLAYFSEFWKSVTLLILIEWLQYSLFYLTSFVFGLLNNEKYDLAFENDFHTYLALSQFLESLESCR